MNEKSKKNLVRFTPETAKKLGSKGGKASVQTRRRKKKMKQAMDMLLSLPVSDVNKAKLEQMGIDEADVDNQMLMLTVAFQQAVKGNVKAMHFIKEVSGSTPITDLEKQKLKLEKERIKIMQQQLEIANNTQISNKEDAKDWKQAVIDIANQRKDKTDE